MKKENDCFYSNSVFSSRGHASAGISSILSQILSVIVLRPQAQQ